MLTYFQTKAKTLTNNVVAYVRTGRMYDGYPTSSYAIELIIFVPIIIVCIVLLCTVPDARGIVALLLGVSLVYMLRLWRLLPGERVRRGLEVNLLLMIQVRFAAFALGDEEAPAVGLLPQRPSQAASRELALVQPSQVEVEEENEYEMEDLPSTMRWYAPVPPSPTCFIPAALESSQQFLQHVSQRESLRCPRAPDTGSHEPFDTNSFPASHSPFPSPLSGGSSGATHSQVGTARDTCHSAHTESEVLTLSGPGRHQQLHMQMG